MSCPESGGTPDTELPRRLAQDVNAARRAARTYQACLLGGFALPVLGLLAFAFMF
jgi:CHASE3 domain sensor protein